MMGLSKNAGKLNRLFREQGRIGVEAVYRAMRADHYEVEEIAMHFSEVLGKEIKPSTVSDWASDFGWTKPRHAHEGNEEAIGVA
jgi:hypothetical protein